MTTQQLSSVLRAKICSRREPWDGYLTFHKGLLLISPLVWEWAAKTSISHLLGTTKPARYNTSALVIDKRPLQITNMGTKTCGDGAPALQESR